MNFKHYMLSLALVVLCLFTITIIADHFVRGVPNAYQFKYDKLTKNQEDFNTIILGSSHTYYDLNPDYFEKPTLNLANPSQDFKYDHYILEQSVAHIANLKTVILPVSYMSLFTDLGEPWRAYLYVYYFNYPIENWLNIRNYSATLTYPSKTKLLGALFDYYIKGNFQSTWSHLGWGEDYTDDDKTDLALYGKKMAKNHHLGNKYYGQNINLLNDMLKICKENHLKLILFFPPGHETYRKHFDPNRLQQIDTFLKTVEQDNQNVKYINLLADDRFVPADFHDSDHLNHTGSKKLSQLFQAYLK